MDAADAFRQGLDPMVSRPPPQTYYTRKPPPSLRRDDTSDGESAANRIAHTLTACCRCRQRKTRCDPTLPRCLPCERSGSVCEYFDTTKGRKISRFYVVKLQEKVRQLEAELAQYTDEDNEYPRNNEEIVRPGGLVRLNESDETPRYLGPSSGIAMTRLLMEGAKRFTESARIAELVPDVRARRMERLNRMQSISMSFSAGGSGGPNQRKKSYPMISAHPAQSLPTRPIVDKLLEVFTQRAQVLTPILHETTLRKDLEDVYAGSQDAFKNFSVRMMMAISLQKLDSQYAGLADSYYLSSMQYFEDVVRPKDIKTLQCLSLIGQYSLLTPTRMAVYYTVGLATRICQQLGLDEEKTVSAGYSMGLMDPLTLDLRRRMSWICATQEYGLAHSMGRPNGFSKDKDLLDVEYFAIVDDEHITKEGIADGPISGKKLAAVHFCKMRLLQAEIRRTLYEKKRLEPKTDVHPWFNSMRARIQEWLDMVPTDPAWCKPWFTGRYHTMVVFMHRPSPQIPRPSPEASQRCYDSCAFLLELFNQQVQKAAVDVTWVLLLTIYMSLNTILWSISYKEVRDAHPREEIDALVNKALVMMDQCAERWPGVESVSQLYSVFAAACMHSYDAKPEKRHKAITAHAALDTPPSMADSSSPDLSGSNSAFNPQQSQQQTRPDPPLFNAPQFGYVFDSAPQPIDVEFTFDNDSPFQNDAQPAFRSNSIFMNPASSDSNGRRFSYFPPEVSHHPSEAPLLDPSSEGPTPAADSTATPYSSHASPPLGTPASNTASVHPLPTPPASLSSMQATHSSLSPPLNMVANSPAFPGMQPQASPRMMPVQQSPALTSGSPFRPDGPQPATTLNPQQLSTMPLPHTSPSPSQPPTPQPPARTPRFTIPPPPKTTTVEQRPLPAPPTTVTDWYRPPAPLISPYSFSSGAMTGSFWGDNASAAAAVGSAFPGLTNAGAANMMANGGAGGPFGMQSINGAPTSNPAEWPNMANFTMNQYSFPGFERHGSLSQEQQVELMDVLETQGMGEMDALLMGLSNGPAGNIAPVVGSGQMNGSPQTNASGLGATGPSGNGEARWA